MSQIVRNFSAGNCTFHLVIFPNFLNFVGNSIYSFLLSGSSVVSKIFIYVNLPPIHGTFEVVPSSGVAMETLFLMYAASWYGNDLPLSYLFGFIDVSSANLLILLGNSEQSYFMSMLPASQDARDFFVTCELFFFVSNNAKTTLLVDVRVLKPANKSTALSYEYKPNTLLGGEVNEIKPVVVCIESPNCVSLNTENCSCVTNTCSRCLSSYVGVSGDSNTI